MAAAEYYDPSFKLPANYQQYLNQRAGSENEEAASAKYQQHFASGAHPNQSTSKPAGAKSGGGLGDMALSAGMAMLSGKKSKVGSTSGGSGKVGMGALVGGLGGMGLGGVMDKKKMEKGGYEVHAQEVGSESEEESEEEGDEEDEDEGRGSGSGSDEDEEEEEEEEEEGSDEDEDGDGSGTSTYFAYPSSKQTDKAILLLSDVMGHKFPNAQLIADQFAANGYFVMMPDLFHGDPLPLNRPPDFDIMKWLGGPPGHKTDRVDPVVEASIKELKEKHGVKKIAAVGYCFGAKYVARFMAEGKGIDVGYMAHPSFVDAEELKAITGPLSISAAETDQIFPAEKRHESEVILKDSKLPYQINLYSHVEHGFAVRTDISDKQKKFAKELAFEQAVAWFNFYL
ncbi:Protein AIM2 [Sphaceloma murrayae]|uniref:Protein AIM2 n=1 Tax=Sphaceloma murrayae TaxID=2082308 RepID=A0A2K1R027_9PEZI|nr:Protein AIM2 [Sphaceloma murrayae]